MTESLITHLRHVDLAVPDYERQLAFYAGTWGLTTVASDRDIAFLAAEGSPERYVIRLRRDPGKRLDLVAFGAASAAEVDALAARLIERRVTLAAEPGSLKTEGGGYGLRFFDLDGRTIEVSADVATRRHRKIEERESIPVRLSHVVLNSTDPDATARWYADMLGFRLSDTLAGPEMGTVMNFMRCNPRHHSVAFARGPHVSLHHVSFELRGIDEFMRGTGRVLRSGARMVWGPGRHLAGAEHLRLLPRPAAQHGRVHHRARRARRGHVAPARLRHARRRGAGPVGHGEPDERAGRQGVIQRPGSRSVHRPAGLRALSGTSAADSPPPARSPPAGAGLPPGLPRAGQTSWPPRGTLHPFGITQDQSVTTVTFRENSVEGDIDESCAAGRPRRPCPRRRPWPRGLLVVGLVQLFEHEPSKHRPVVDGHGRRLEHRVWFSKRRRWQLRHDPDHAAVGPGRRARRPARVAAGPVQRLPDRRVQVGVRDLEAQVRHEQDRRLPAVGDQQRLPAGAAADPVRHAQVRRRTRWTRSRPPTR